MNIRNAILGFLLLLSFWLDAQHLVPPIHNYKVFDYNAASQNWGLATDEDGGVFVANNKGLLHFNGEQWRLYKLPNNTIIRSVAYVKGRIYTGSYEEFGYWTMNPLGLLEYTSLTHLMDGNVSTIEEFWEIIPYKEKIVFRSFFKIYIYENDKIEIIQPESIVMDLEVFQDKLVVAGDTKGLFWLMDNKLVPWQNQEFLNEKNIVDLEVLNNDLIVGTKLEGCFLLKNGVYTPFDENINRELRLHQLNKITYLNTGKIAFGTIKNGIYLYDIKRKSIERLNRETGLQNNTVLSMSQFKDDLWIGLDNGIDRVQLNSPITYFTDFSGVLGTVYDMTTHDGQLYLGSNTGVYTFVEDKLQFLEGSQGHVWDLEVLDDDLLVGHNTGTYKVANRNFEKLTSYAGGYQFIRIPDEKTVFLQGTYNGIAKYEKKLGGQWEVTRISGLDFPVKQFCFENNNTMWVAHPYKGLYRIKINTTHDTILESKEFSPKEIPNNYNIKLYNIKNQIIIQSEGLWYRYDPIADKIDLFSEFSAFRNKELVNHDNKHFWFIDNENTKELIYTDLKQDSLVMLLETQMRRRLLPEAENMLKVNDSMYYYTLGDGFAKINFLQLTRNVTEFTFPEPKLTFFKDEERLYAIDGSEPFKITYKKSRDITMQFAAPGLTQPKYYYQLTGPKIQQFYLDRGTVNFQNLPYGDYVLEIATVGMGNKSSAPLKLEFEINPPWYWSVTGKIAYFLLLLGIVFGIRKYNRSKLHRKQNELKQRMLKQQEEQLLALEKEKMAKEVRSKQKELTSTAMNVAKKNQLILELKSMLLMNKDKFTNHQPYKSFIKKLDHSINDDEDWRSFEINFKELHEDFFEILLDKYSGLTPKDLKLCAYLKMNLSSKEIAPLMGITTRGVEIHRYRLRKKLQIDGSENISNFLITLK